MTTSKRRPQIIFFIVGALLLLTSYILIEAGGTQPSEGLKFWSGALLNLAFVLLTVVVVDFLWGVLGGEPISETLAALGNTLTEMRSSVSLLRDSKTSGLERIFPGSGAAGNHADWMQRLCSSRTSVDLMGYTLHVWTRGVRFEDEVIKLVRAGVKIRILIMDETNPFLEALVNHGQIPAVTMGSVTEEIKTAKAVFSGIAAKLGTAATGGGYQFRTLKKGLIVTQLCRTDSRITSVQYLYSVVASRSPLLDVTGAESELGRIYVDEFESLWAIGDPA